MTDDPEEGMLSWDESVFRDEHVFEIDYVPETFLHRETQMENLKYALHLRAAVEKRLRQVVDLEDVFVAEHRFVPRQHPLLGVLRHHFHHAPRAT